MPDYAVLRVIWWLLLGTLLIGFAITDGFDLGLATIFRAIGRSEAERHALIASIEPVWDGNQVWLILGGGASFAAWPLLYATSFSALYPAMFLVLVALILRPVGFGFRNQLQGARWRGSWDWALTIGGAAPALLFGVAFGNLFLGLPFHFDNLQRVIYTGGFWNLLRPWALLCGLVSLAMLVMQGASYAALKSSEPLRRRAERIGAAAAVTFIVLFVAGGLTLRHALTGYRLAGSVDPSGVSNPLLKSVTTSAGGWLENFQHWPWMWLAPAAALLGAALAGALLLSRRAPLAFVASSVAQAGTILTAGFALFPFLLPSSSEPAQSLTIWDASSSEHTLAIMLVAVVIFLPLVLAYTVWVYRLLRARGGTQ